MITGVLVTLLLAGQATTVDGPERVLDTFMAAFNARDAARTAALYAPDAEFMPPDGPPVKGRRSIEAAFAAAFTQTRVIDLLSMKADISGTNAVVAGRLTMSTRTREARAEIVSGSYLVVLRKIGGDWKIAYHMYTLPLRPDFVGSLRPPTNYLGQSHPKTPAVSSA